MKAELKFRQRSEVVLWHLGITFIFINLNSFKMNTKANIEWN
ncbi:hypothetical protein SAMN04487979_10572 [Flavobacterium sp. ov086]|nr:hypothetical protein SAMN04487979_10572 [Flavobacterium sp. ov086]